MSSLQTATTLNGAASYGTVNDPLVELFFKSVRDTPCTDYRCIKVKNKKGTDNVGTVLESYFDAAWEIDPLRTLKFVFYLRDCRNGKGERKLFRALIRHMRENGLTKHIAVNMEHIPTFGSWKDISICFFGTELEDQAVRLIVDQLKVDKEAVHPTLCAKYAPSESGAIDKVHKAASKIAAGLGVSLTGYRKKYLTPLRNKLNIVEQKMCAKEWNEIEYQKTPSIAGMKYKNAFSRHDEERYKEYLNRVMKGEKKMNVGVLMPYQMVRPYLAYCGVSNHPKDDTIEAQWSAFLAYRRSKWPEGINVLPLVDVSGSMFCSGEPLAGHVAISLGILFAHLNTAEEYRNKFINFSTEPKMIELKGDCLYDQIHSIDYEDWSGTTDFQKAFDLILNIAVEYGVPADEMPKILLIFSDMQFNYTGSSSTNWEEIEDKYTAAGYRRPTIIFWNLNGKTTDYPIPDANTPDCMLLSGYNDSIMYSLLDGNIPTPHCIINKALNDECYSMIKLA